MKCNYNCFECPYETCVNDKLSDEEIAISEWLDNLATKDNIVDSNMVIRTGKRGRPRKVFPLYENEEYKRKRLKKSREYYYQHKAERLEYAKKRWANMSAEQKQRELEKGRENYRKRKEKAIETIQSK